MRKTIGILGCGWFGLGLGQTLAKNGMTVYGTTTREKRLKELNGNEISGLLYELGNELPLELRTADILVIAVPPSSVSDFGSKMQKLINELIDSSVTKIIYISSSSVYPDLNREVFEADATYIKSKHSGVELLRTEDIITAASINYVILRFAGLYGPGRLPGGFLSGKRNISGGSSPVNLVHLDDCIGVTKQLISSDITNEVFNVCSDAHPTREEFYTKACIAQGREKPHFNDVDTSYKIVNTDKLKRVINYQFIHPDPMKDI